MRTLFTDHPKSVGETYLQHFTSAMTFALMMIGGFVICTIHAIFPFLLKKSGSNIIKQLHKKMVTQRNHGKLETRRIQQTAR